MGDTHHSETNLAEEEQFGKADPILPYAIGGGVIGLLCILMLTVGSHAVPLDTFLSFVAVLVWGGMGLFLVIIYPVMIGVSTTRTKKFLPIVGTVLLGIAYFVVSGIFMANASLPIQ